jgi:hypothetical protein
MLLDLSGVSDFDTCPDGHTLVYDQVDQYRGTYAFYDLVSWDLDRQRRRRLTRGARVREPACAPGGWAAAVQLDHGRSRLVRVDLGTGAVTVLYDPGGIDQVGHPAVSPDGRTVVAVVVTQGRGRDLVAIDVATGRLRQLTDDAALELHPRFSPDGRWLVYVSDRTGIYDAYAQPWPEGPPRRLTRMLGGALEAQPGPGGTLALRQLTPGGEDLGVVPFAPGAPLPAGDAEPPTPTRPAASERPLPTRPYEPLDSFWPVAWAPGFAFSSAEDSLTQVGLSFSAGDAAGHHFLLGNVGTTPDGGALHTSLIYGYRRFTPALTLSLSHSTLSRANAAYFGFAPQDRRERVTSAAGSVSVPFSHAEHGVSASARLGYTRIDPAPDTDATFAPDDRSPVLPEPFHSVDLTIGVRYSNLEAYPDAISVENGLSMGTTLRLRDRRFGGDADTVELFFDYEQYVPLWWRNVLALHVNGGLGRGDTGRRVFFALGGTPDYRNILLDALDNIAFGSTFLRGYPAGIVRGDRFVLATAEYRLPLFDLFRGPATAPLFFERLKLAFFSDWGQASTSPEELSLWPSAFRRSVGAELSSEATLAWRLPVNIRLGYARGLDADGESQTYVFLGSWF